MKNVFQQTWRLWPFLPLIFGLGASAVVCGALFARNLVAQGDTTCPEGAVVYAVRGLTEPHGLYRDYREVPYATTPYPPLYYLCSAALAAVLGGDIDATYLAGRWVALTATLASAALVFLIVRQATGSAGAAWVGMGTTATISFLHPWDATCRPDTLALAFALLGVFQIRREHRSGQWFATMAFLGSMLAKHSFVAAPAAAVLWLVVQGRTTRAVSLAAGLTVGFLVAGGICQWLSGGWFWFNVFGANVAPLVFLQPLEFTAFFFSGGVGTAGADRRGHLDNSEVDAVQGQSGRTVLRHGDDGGHAVVFEGGEPT